MNKQVSVIITTCNRPVRYIKRALKSVLAQTYKNIEIIVVDDSSADYSDRQKVREAVFRLCPDVIYIMHPDRKGAPVARNDGIKAASGEYIAFLDDDDEWLPKKIEAQLKGFTAEDITLVYCDIYIKDDIAHKEWLQKGKRFEGRAYGKLLEYGCFIGSTSVPLIRKAALEQIGGFDIELKSLQDYDLYIRLAHFNKIKYINGAYVVYHIHKGKRISTSFENRISGISRFNEKYRDYMERDPKAWMMAQIRLLLCYSHDRRIKEALKVWVKLVSKRPFEVFDNMRYLFHILFTSEWILFRIYRWLREKIRTIRMKSDE